MYRARRILRMKRMMKKRAPVINSDYYLILLLLSIIITEFYCNVKSSKEIKDILTFFKQYNFISNIRL